jgi:DNA-binding transcriptional LysR family regulator
MVTVETLEALDLLIWLGSGALAGERARCNQSTVSRRIRQAQSSFGLKLQRRGAQWHLSGNSLLLQMEREVHQVNRIHHNRPLRLQAPAWSHDHLLRPLPQGWIINPSDGPGSPHHCLDLLKARVVDACLATLPERPSSDDHRFTCFDLYRSPIHLVSLADSRVVDISSPTRLEIGSCCQISTFPFNPRAQKLFIHNFFQHHFQPDQAYAFAGQRQKEAVYFANSLMLKSLRSTLPVVELDVAVPSHYVESLVVLHDNRNAPAIAELVDTLRRRIQDVSRSEEKLTPLL